MKQPPGVFLFHGVSQPLFSSPPLLSKVRSLFSILGWHFFCQFVSLSPFLPSQALFNYQPFMISSLKESYPFLSHGAVSFRFVLHGGICFPRTPFPLCAFGFFPEGMASSMGFQRCSSRLTPWGPIHSFFGQSLADTLRIAAKMGPLWTIKMGKRSCSQGTFYPFFTNGWYTFAPLSLFHVKHSSLLSSPRPREKDPGIFPEVPNSAATTPSAAPRFLPAVGQENASYPTERILVCTLFTLMLISKNSPLSFIL